MFANLRLMALTPVDTLPILSDTIPLPVVDSTIILPATADTPVVGIASYYADRFEGRRTSSGEIFRQSKMTAAHNTLPLGTWIRVTRLDNGNQVVVRINDRMHPRNPRLVDLSKTAARKLGYIGMGVVMVSIEQLGMSPPPDQ
jgi:rare lipoprotein A (peptidoglycan hydrolase)